ncbi:twin transmembrane helix small protein [Sulfitobacter sp. JB4-11]|uniref:twin transmembrane helix small protein n=1 Tax=Sulfitobacter rhodophyticola TaxID=3238304 RepID=UPI00351241A8
MFDDPLFTVVLLAVLAVMVVLMIGLGGFAGGGAFNKKHGNRMMRYRIIAQAIAVILIVGFVWLRGGTD